MGKKRKLIEAWAKFEEGDKLPCDGIECKKCNLYICIYNHSGSTINDILENKYRAIQHLKDHPKKQKIDIEPDWGNDPFYGEATKTYLKRVWIVGNSTHLTQRNESEKIPGTERTRPKVVK